MQIIDGQALAASHKEQIAKRIEELTRQGRRKPVLSVVIVGDDPASHSYVRGKEKACISVGMENRTIKLPEDTQMDELLHIIQTLNEDKEVDGILVQMPLPKHLDEKKVVRAIDPSKDVDGLHPVNAGKLVLSEPGFVCCTPKGIMAMLASIGLDDLSGKHAVVCGRSNLVGKPVSLLLQKKNATVTMVHSKTQNTEKICSHADILIVAIGRPRCVGPEWVKEGAVVIDVGINRLPDGHLCGDVDFDAVKDKVSAISPVPRGVGPMTVCMLLENTLQAYDMHEGA